MATNPVLAMVHRQEAHLHSAMLALAPLILHRQEAVLHSAMLGMPLCSRQDLLLESAT